MGAPDRSSCRDYRHSPRSNKLIEAMVNEAQRKLALADIRENIARSGLHIYFWFRVARLHRFAYTIGLSESIGAELILAGAIFYMKDDVRKIVNGIAARHEGRPWSRGLRDH